MGSVVTSNTRRKLGADYRAESYVIIDDLIVPKGRSILPDRLANADFGPSTVEQMVKVEERCLG
jgi:hypothetical protein